MSSLYGNDHGVMNPLRLPYDREEQQDNELEGIEKQIMFDSSN